MNKNHQIQAEVREFNGLMDGDWKDKAESEMLDKTRNACRVMSHHHQASFCIHSTEMMVDEKPKKLFKITHTSTMECNGILEAVFKCGYSIPSVPHPHVGKPIARRFVDGKKKPKLARKAQLIKTGKKKAAAEQVAAV